jgi:hypothetical protein
MIVLISVLIGLICTTLAKIIGWELTNLETVLIGSSCYFLSSYIVDRIQKHK